MILRLSDFSHEPKEFIVLYRGGSVGFSRFIRAVFIIFRLVDSIVLLVVSYVVVLSAT